MTLVTSFDDPADATLSRTFFTEGYVVRPVDDLDVLKAIRTAIVGFACEHLGIPAPADEDGFLNGLHQRVAKAEINPLRLHIFQRLNAHDWCGPSYFALARQALYALVGNELAMQNKVNLSIQMPDDESSVLSVHSDVWAGETPYEVVQWTPLVDVHDSKAMYILAPEINRGVRAKIDALPDKGKSFDFYEAYKDDFHFVPVKFGETLVFSPILLHGNIVNRVPETRWSLNTRYTGLFTPYASEEKCLGRFYLPATTRPASRIGLNYKMPKGF